MAYLAQGVVEPPLPVPSGRLGGGSLEEPSQTRPSSKPAGCKTRLGRRMRRDLLADRGRARSSAFRSSDTARLPPSRFLQWKAKMAGAQGENAEVRMAWSGTNC